MQSNQKVHEWRLHDARNTPHQELGHHADRIRDVQWTGGVLWRREGSVRGRTISRATAPLSFALRPSPSRASPPPHSRLLCDLVLVVAQLLEELQRVILAYMCVKLKCVCMCVTVWVHFGSILGPFWVHFGSILGPFWVHCGSIVGPLWVHFGSILGPIVGPLWVHCGSIVGPLWVHCGSIVGPFWVHFGPLWPFCLLSEW